jgi:penicillin-binding protein 1C
MEWFYRKKHFEYRPLPPWRADCRDNAPDNTAAVSIIYPRRGSAIYIPVELGGNRGRTVFMAAHRDAAATLHWHLDNEYLGATKGLHQMSCAPAEGKHVLTVVDAHGEKAEQAFEIIGR